MTSKKLIIIFLLILLILSIFNFSSVHAENITENINVTSSSSERMKSDIDYFKQLLKNNNINNINDLVSFFGANSANDIGYFCIIDAGHFQYNNQSVRFYSNFNDISVGVDNYSYYGIQQNSFTLHYNYSLWYGTDGSNALHKSNVLPNYLFTAPSCWFAVRTADLFTKDSSQIVANAVGNVNNSVDNVNNSINNLNDKITEDNSSQDDINLNSHNNEMNNASDSIKNSNLYTKFNNIIDKMDDAFSYTDDEPSVLFLAFNGKTFVLKSDEISSFLKYNNLGFVITLWQSVLWFSLFYTMFIFIRKLYKAVAGGNPVDEVSSTLSNEDNKIVGGF